MHIGFWSGNLRIKGRLGDLGIAGRIILKCLRSFIWAWCSIQSLSRLSHTSIFRSSCGVSFI